MKQPRSRVGGQSFMRPIPVQTPFYCTNGCACCLSSMYEVYKNIVLAPFAEPWQLPWVSLSTRRHTFQLHWKNNYCKSKYFFLLVCIGV